MRKLVTNTLVSLDWVMQGSRGPEEDPTGSFEQGGWLVQLLGRSDERVHGRVHG
jgi:hypothetical protein